MLPTGSSHNDPFDSRPEPGAWLVTYEELPAATAREAAGPVVFRIPPRRLGAKPRAEGSSGKPALKRKAHPVADNTALWTKEPSHPPAFLKRPAMPCAKRLWELRRARSKCSSGCREPGLSAINSGPDSLRRSPR